MILAHDAAFENIAVFELAELLLLSASSAAISLPLPP